MRKHRDAVDAHRSAARAARDCSSAARTVVGRGARARRAARLPQRPGHGARADRHDRLHDGLRHDRHRARHRARQVQEARRRRHAQDRQPAPCPLALLRRSATRADEVEAIVEHIDEQRHDRGRAAPQGRAPAGLRLRVQARQRRALDPLHGPHPHDGGGPAVPLGRDLARPSTCPTRPPSRTSRTPTSRPGSWPQGDRGLPRRLQAHQPLSTGKKKDSDAAASTTHGGAMRRRSRSLGSPSPTGAACRTSAAPSRTSSRSPATRATSPSASTRTASPARSSSAWRRKAPRSAA